MFRPLTLYIGLRYTRAKKRNQFVSFISLMSMIGIALGVMVLITVLSVMNGFDQQIRGKLFSMVPHITILSNEGKINNWQTLMPKIKQNPSVTTVIPMVSGQGMIVKNTQTMPTMINGILPDSNTQIFDLPHKMVAGSLHDLTTQSFGIVLGAGIASNLGVVVGDSVNIITPTAVVTPVGLIPRFKQFKVVGVFEVGAGFAFDSSYAFISLASAQKLFMLDNDINMFNVNVKDLLKAPDVAWQLQKNLGDQYQVSDWTQEYGPYYSAVKMEKTMMFFILILIIAIAAFNLVSGLMMGVNDKQADIAILRTLGLTPKKVMTIFVIQGGLIGGIGTLLGIVLGIILSLNITALTNLIEKIFHIQFLNPSVYLLDYLPSQLQWGDVWHVALIAFAMSLIATLYPAWRASKVQPAEALRYE